MIFFCYLLAGLAVLCLQNSAWAQQHPHAEKSYTSVFTHFESNSPVGLSEDHYHTEGSWMLTYKYMPMWMDGTLSSNEDLSKESIHNSFMVAPLEMRMDMHMIGVMYAVSNRFTIMAMGNYTQNHMDLETRIGMPFTTASSGIGDISLTALYVLKNTKNQSLHAIAGVSAPIGDINQADQTPMSENALLAYPMQLGSGTWDPSFGATYLLNTEHFCWGLQAKYKFRIGENNNSYTLGNVFNTNLWTSYQLNKFWSLSARTEFINQASTEGANPDFNPMMMPLFNTANSGRSQLNLNAGINLKFPTMQLDGLQFGVELGYPVYQKVTGIQMKNGLTGTIGLKYTLGGTHPDCH